ncbi:F0F1 ATP synthase subunit B [Arcicella lustrica]|uniref:ATP synthase subunit b n=1 Tax=Arcicella lustrica TaxID=2984196 RepID=A0ABU5SEY2_9BACT|nr:F0F1 ATP synthase subunit B [Arcicella sp. DC25W]MEA5425839.1 F0F1 ATP synthase subunit B [Arcicella sp. DC25W]
MDLITPGLGLIVWQLVIFGLLFFLLSKFAWKPIMASLQEREQSIEDALSLAAKTRQEMAELKAGNEKLIAEARAERDRVLKEAKEASEAMIAQAKAEAQKAGAEEIEKARAAFNQEKVAAVASLRKEAASLSLEIAEKVLRNQLADRAAQEALVTSLLADAKLN